MRDTIYRNDAPAPPPEGRDGARPDHNDLVDFRFDASTVAVFPDMIRRSVPAYEQILSLGGWLLSRQLADNSICYDLGCSLLASSLVVDRYASVENLSFIGVDNSADMLASARTIAQHQFTHPVHLINADISRFPLQPCSGVILNFTLQFVAPEERLRLLTHACEMITPGGALLLSEKLLPDAAQDHGDFFEAAHLDFKLANGYSNEEIDRKRTALENVLVPECSDTHIERLHTAGFSRVLPWFQCMNWGSFLAIA